MRKHGGPPSRHVKQSRWRRSALLVLPGAALLGATSQVQRDVRCLPSSRAEPILFVTGGTPRGTMGRLSTTECTYLPTSHKIPRLLYKRPACPNRPPSINNGSPLVMLLHVLGSFFSSCISWHCIITRLPCTKVGIAIASEYSEAPSECQRLEWRQKQKQSTS